MKHKEIDRDMALKKLERIEQNPHLRIKADKLTKQWEPRSILERSKPLRSVAQIGKWAFSLLSIALGFYFIQSLFFVAVPHPGLSIICALGVQIFWELAKHRTLPLILRTWLIERTIHTSFLLINIALIGLSIIFSMLGMQKYSEDHMEIKPVEVSMDSIRSYYNDEIAQMTRLYDQKIQAVQQEQQNFTGSIEWKGKVNWYDPTTKALMERFTKRTEDLENTQEQEVAKLREDKRAALRQAEKENTFRAQEAKEASALNIYYMIAFALIVEIGGFACLTYLTINAFYANKEIQELRESITASQAAKLARMKKAMAQVYANEAERKELEAKTEVKNMSKEEMELNKKYKYDSKIRDLYEKGVTNVSQLARAAGCTRQTVYFAFDRMGLQKKD